MKNSNNANDLEIFAERITHCISIKHMKAPIEEKDKSTKPIKGMHIPFILALSQLQKLATRSNAKTEKKKHSVALDLKNCTLSKKSQQTAQEAEQCCFKQDLHLLPFKELILEKTLSFRKIVDWKVLKPLLAKKQLKNQISSSLLPKSHKIEVISQQEKDYKEKERMHKEQIEIMRCQREERQFQITRIIDYFTK